MMGGHQLPSIGGNQNFGAPGQNMSIPEILNNQQKALSQNFPPQSALMTNNGMQDNLNIPQYQNRPPQKPMPGKDSKQKPKPSGRKMTPNGDKKQRDNGNKVPSVKKPKIIESIKLHFVQQYFKASDIAETVNPEGFMDEIKQYQDINNDGEGEYDDKKPEEDAEAEEEPKQEEEEPVQQEEEPVEEREPEQHEEYEPSEDGEKESSKDFEPYDPNNIMELEVKVSTKVKGLKKMILEKIDLHKKASIILLKKAEPGMVKQIEQATEAQAQNWVQMTEAELDMPVKTFVNQTIAFKAYMSISVCVEGRGQSYHQQVQVDPMDKLERTMRQKTHFWKSFMSRG